MRFVDVRNNKETSSKALPSGYSSWLDYWEKKKGRKANMCGVINCKGTPVEGGHVVEAGLRAKEYILPMCANCCGKSEQETFGAWKSDLEPL